MAWVPYHRQRRRVKKYTWTLNIPPEQFENEEEKALIFEKTIKDMTETMYKLFNECCVIRSNLEGINCRIGFTVYRAPRSEQLEREGFDAVNRHIPDSGNGRDKLNSSSASS